MDGACSTYGKDEKDQITLKYPLVDGRIIWNWILKQ
jgi:hypothetical protein